MMNNNLYFERYTVVDWCACEDVSDHASLDDAISSAVRYAKVRGEDSPWFLEIQHEHRYFETVEVDWAKHMRSE